MSSGGGVWRCTSVRSWVWSPHTKRWKHLFKTSLQNQCKFINCLLKKKKGCMLILLQEATKFDMISYKPKRTCQYLSLCHSKSMSTINLRVLVSRCTMMRLCIVRNRHQRRKKKWTPYSCTIDGSCIHSIWLLPKVTFFCVTSTSHDCK